MNKIIRVDFSKRGKDLRELEKIRKEDLAQERIEERIRKTVN